MPVIMGTAARTVNKPVATLVTPDDVVTVTLRPPGAAAVSIVILTESEVAEPPGTMAAITPVPENVTEFTDERFVPVITAVSIVPATPLLGVIAEIAGTGTASTWN
jgi:hypothetical protein